jgi:diguanylate cyclase (GGDEF)-like protein
MFALHEASSLLAAQTADADAVLEQVLRSAVNLLDGGSGSLYRWDRAAGMLRCVRNWQVPSRDVTPDLRPGEGLAGQTFARSAPVIVNDYSTWELGMNTGRVGGMRAGLGVPLIRQGICLGVLLVRVYQDEQARPFDLDDARLATLFGDQVAAALLTADAFEQHRYAVLHDSLTGLPNRILLADRVQQAILAAKREGTALTVLAMDLDRFKDVNDTFGHAAGDTVLREVGARLGSVLRTSDTVARMGGDEFAVLLPATGQEGSAQIARALIEAIKQPFTQDGHVVEIGLSIGAAIFPEHGEDADTLLRHADMAMYVAKRANGGCVAYALEHGEQTRDRITRLGDLRRAIDGGELVLHYQPKIHCAERRVMGVEALVRWQHPERGLMAPDLFIPMAEQSGLIKQLTRHVGPVPTLCWDWAI